ncbi:hypothetical protein EV210_101136 [Anaerospora hongkongensis]|uniref:Uncharacterized protein n=1 Tax=Anaerospora hongkongensis TaxID=244830 RepID=A0A4R1Q374_9FIRM|nr:hypothetical protein [Anaerospora hongkongensis]TCL39938.1 hypothetical protein EV210_101136 [Anaerospora hongkongensis]
MIKQFIKDNWKLIICSILVVVLGCFIYSEYQEWKQHSRSQNTTPVINVNTNGEAAKPGETQVVYVQGETVHTKELVYVPKETNAATGITEKTDVQFDKRQGIIYVKVNGKEFEVPANVKEDSKFENGKFVVTEQTEMHINLTTPKPAVNLGVGWGINGPAAQVNGPLYKNVSFWVYGDQKTAAGGLQFPIMKR